MGSRTSEVRGVAAVSADRDSRLDVLKAFAITLVILGHAILLVYSRATGAPPALAVIFSVLSVFHVPLFVFVSGYLSPARQRISWVRSRAGRLLLPFAAWTILQWVVLLRAGDFGWLLTAFAYPTRSNAWFLYVLFVVSALCAVLSARPWLLVAASAAGLLLPARLGDPLSMTYVTMLLPVFVAGRLASKRHFEPGPWVLPLAVVLLAAFWTVPGANLMNAVPAWAATLGAPTAGWLIDPVVVLIRVLRLALQLSLAGSALFLFRGAKRGAWLGRLTLGVYCMHPFFMPPGLAGTGPGGVAAVFVIASAGAIGVTLLLGKWRPASVLLLGGGFGTPAAGPVTRAGHP